MELKIDTVKDSKEDLIKAIEFLKSIAGEKQPSSMNSSASIKASMDGMNMFSDNGILPGGNGSGKKDSDDDFDDSTIQVIPY